MGRIAVKKARIAAITAEEDAWVRRAYAASVAAAKDVVGDRGPIRSNTAIGKLGDSEWGWIASAIIWAWVSTRAQQATEEGWNAERTVRATELQPCPWNTGAAVAILPKLADACPDFNWSQPAGEWSKEALAEFLLKASELIRRAWVARDVAERQLGSISADVTARGLNAAAGNSRMTPDEQEALDRGDLFF